MKNAKFLRTVAVLILLSAYTGCSKQIDIHNSTEDMLVRANWGIEYTLNNQNITADFTDCSLLFGTRGSLVFKKGNDSFHGTWKKTMDNTVEIITIHFDTSNPILDLLNEEWITLTRTDRSILFESDLVSPTSLFTIRMN